MSLSDFDKGRLAEREAILRFLRNKVEHLQGTLVDDGLGHDDEMGGFDFVNAVHLESIKIVNYPQGELEEVEENLLSQYEIKMTKEELKMESNTFSEAKQIAKQLPDLLERMKNMEQMQDLMHKRLVCIELPVKYAHKE